MQTDPVVVEIVTAANLAGIEQAKVGLLGFNASTLGLAAGIGILAFATESAVKIAEGHATALGRVKQASDVSGTSFDANRKSLEDFIKANQAFIPDNNKAIESFATLLRSTGSQTMAMDGLRTVMNLTAITGKDWDASTQAVNLGLQGSGRALRELGIDIGALRKDQENFIVATKDLTKAKAEVERATKEHDKAERSLEEYMVQIGRPGHRLTTEELMRLKDHKDRVAEAAKNLATANKDLATAQDQSKNASKLQAEVLQQLTEKTKDGANYTSEFTRNTNELKGKWSEMGQVWGQSTLVLLKQLTDGAKDFANTWDALSKNDAMWGSISKRLTDMASGAKTATAAAGGGLFPPAGSVDMTQMDGSRVRILADGTKIVLSGPNVAPGGPASPVNLGGRTLAPGEYIDPVTGKVFSATNPQEQSGWYPRPQQPASTGSGWADITAQQNYQLALKQWETTQRAREEALAAASNTSATLKDIEKNTRSKPSNNVVINIQTVGTTTGLDDVLRQTRNLIVT